MPSISNPIINSMKKIIGLCAIAISIAAQSFAQSDTTKTQPPQQQVQYDSIGSWGLTPWHVKEYNRLEAEKQKLIDPINTVQDNMIKSFLASHGVNMEDPNIRYTFTQNGGVMAVRIKSNQANGASVTSAGNAKPKETKSDKKDTKKKGQ